MVEPVKTIGSRRRLGIDTPWSFSTLPRDSCNTTLATIPSAARLEHIVRHLEATGLKDRCTLAEWLPAENAVLGLVHEEKMIRNLEQLANTGGGRARC